MTEQERKKITVRVKNNKYFTRSETDYIVNMFEEVQKYREIGTLDECRAAVEKQKEMIAYCDANDCSDCPYHNGNYKENRCMNDFISDEIVKGGGVNGQ